MVHRKEAVHKDTAKFSLYLREVIVLQPRLYPDFTNRTVFTLSQKKPTDASEIGNPHSGILFEKPTHTSCYEKTDKHKYIREFIHDLPYQ